MSITTRPLRAAFFGACSICISASLLGCAEELEQDPKHPERVQVIFDPATSTIPLPNQAAVQADGTLPKSEAPRDTAQAAFYAWIDDLHGWLPETPIEVPLDGELDASTIDLEDALLWRVEQDESLTALAIKELRYELVEAEEAGPARSKIVIVPVEPLKAATRYGAVLKTSINGANGEPILAPLAIFFGLNNGPLFEEESGRVTIPQLQGDPDTAEALERSVRRSLTPITSNLSEIGLDRKEIAAAFTWSTGVDAFTVLDPSTATIPLPNTLALDPGSDGLPTFPRAPLQSLVEYERAEAAGESPELTAQIYFERYLDDLHGWPNTVASLPIEVPLSGPIDPATITEESVQLWQILEDGTPERISDLTLDYIALPAEQEGEKGIYKIKLSPARDFRLNTDYFAFVTRDVKDLQGRELLPAGAMAMGLQPHPLLDEEGRSTVNQLDDASAQAATGLQRVLAPFVEAIEDQAGYEYDDLASVWSFYTWRDPFIVFDPLNGDIPFPNAFLIDDKGTEAPEDDTVDLPIEPRADPLTRSLLEELNTRSGFARMAQGWVTVLGELDPESVTYFEPSQKMPGADPEGRGAIAMAARAGDDLPVPVEPERIELDYRSDYGKIMLRPQLPLKQSHQHIVLLTDRLRGTNGLKAQPTPIFVMLTSPFELYDEAQGSLVAQLPDESAPGLEAGRKLYAELFTRAELITGDTRESIVGAFVFTTDDVTTPMQRARARAMAKLEARETLQIERACEVDASRECDEDLLDNRDASQDAYNGPYGDGRARDFSNLQQIQWAGEFRTVDMLREDGNAFASWEDIDEETRVGVSLFVPKRVEGQCEPPFRVVISQHGLTSSRLISGLGMANEFAAPETCLATVVLDTVLHGGRSASSQTLHPVTKPPTSGDGFLSANFVQSKNFLKQGILDLLVLNRLVRQGALEGLVENTTAAGTDPMFDVEEMAVVGTSLGGLFATAAAALDPTLNIAVLNVAPGKLTYYLTEMSTIGEGLLAPLSILGIERGTFVFEQLIAFLQWVGEEVGPAIFASHLIEDRLRALEYDASSDSYARGERVPSAEVFMQMALDDEVAPNVSTRQLARILDIDLEPTTFEAPHAFLIQNDPSEPSFKASECGRRQAAFFLRAAIEGSDTTLPPELVAKTCVGEP